MLNYNGLFFVKIKKNNYIIFHWQCIKNFNFFVYFSTDAYLKISFQNSKTIFNQGA